jgi:hypothetical protein
MGERNEQPDPTTTTAGPLSDALAVARARMAARSVATWTGELIDLGGPNTLRYYRDLTQGTLDPERLQGTSGVDLGSRTAGPPPNGSHAR